MIPQGQFLAVNFSKLKRLCLRRFEDDQTTFPYWFLQNITSLKSLIVEWSSFKEIFQEEIPTNEKRRFEIRTRIKKLILNQLHKLQHISNEGLQVDPILEDLQLLRVVQCSNLKHLVPSSVTFSHLTYLVVENCNGLIYVITSSTARSLVKLTKMKICNCNSLEQVVAEEREGSEDEITFNSLEGLWLECLPMIKRFSSSNCVLNLPSLEGVVAKQCPRMSIFSVKDTSTPMLQEILSKEEDEKIYWEGDLNRTMNKMFVDMVAFPSFKHLNLAEYPELRELWYNHVQPQVNGNLKSLVVHKCDFLSDVLLPLHLVQALSNLEELQVSECDSLEAVFDLLNMDGKEVFVKETIQLKRITLSCLPKLKHIWKQNFQELVNFTETAEGHIQHHRPPCCIQQVLCPNLQVVWVEDCENLEYLFPFYIAMHATQLEHITIKNARSMKQIVSDKEGLMDSPVKFEFNHLISLELWDLYELEGFFAENHSLLCPLLRDLDVRDCAKLKLFKTRSWSSQGGVFDSNSQVSMQQPLFTIEEVICNLENLALNSENLNIILQEQFSVENFSKLKFLCLREFEDDQTTFLYWFLQNITNLEQLIVEWSSFKEIFQEEIPTDEKRRSEIRTRIKKLTLYQLHKLQHISKEAFQIDPILENLEYLNVDQCSNLKYLVPSSVTFSHLTYLEVENCNGLIYLITSSTARSLVKLTEMKIKTCNSLEQVVAEEREGSEDEIAFNSLKVLELECLPMIKRFCSSNCVLNLQWLEKVVVQQCPRMSIFSVKHTSTPRLQEILSKEEDEKIYWEGDLNRTINKMFVDMTNENLKMDTTEASSSKEQVGESKPNQIADIGKQEIHKLPSESYDTQQNKQASSNQDTVIGTQKRWETIDQMPLVQPPQKHIESYHNLEKVNETMEKPLIQTSQHAQRPVVGQDIEESHESETCPNKDSFNQPKTFVTRDKKENIHDTMDKPLIQTDQDAEKLATIQNPEESCDSYTGTQKICNTIKVASISAAQDVSNSTMIPEAAIDPSPSQAPEPVISPTQKLNIYRSYKGMIDIPKQNMPYLEAGVNRHPQVLDWLNTKRRRVFASSTFSLFAEVTCILRTTRKGHLTEDDRSYVRECCSVLEAAGFDVSWLSYVHKCIEECGDAEDIKRKVEETKGQASSLEAQIESMKKELASVKESLVLLLDKARNLDDFIES